MLQIMNLPATSLPQLFDNLWYTDAMPDSHEKRFELLSFQNIPRINVTSASHWFDLILFKFIKKWLEISTTAEGGNNYTGPSPDNCALAMFERSRKDTRYRYPIISIRRMSYVASSRRVALWSLKDSMLSSGKSPYLTTIDVLATTILYETRKLSLEYVYRDLIDRRPDFAMNNIFVIGFFTATAFMGMLYCNPVYKSYLP